MTKRTDRDPNTGKRVLRFVATSAVVVAPISFLACGGATPEATNVDHTDEPHTNVAPEETMNVAPEETNVGMEEEDPATNVGPEEGAEGEDGGGDEESPE